ncbi:tRNA (adenosine(37)-N6)-threonylcarbamoyltransferase complex ATPase subunit type 1 TsaE [Thalassomonas haliotis]|uniref:tRNA threonylcarbamoyladenosine biosynthesis protein TsaE n=1 Tax=Thalassomonas haliotis TaxID=485448 RepID=A0ABY7VFX0_9GAMM|nr:tRNA (adenosine(37)-N6)-threonylcarbamoyltransferase complex ATPase subunit type 1 TsaE [Thalassomonas haliotis]WDE12292.1 tRNA (adenosine(37)-N6)-threonylcarbamoyltransferase complex ATPase subunit type 1 TsaE [Thalassomonas haliotis]
MKTIDYDLADEQATVALGTALAGAIRQLQGQGFVAYLNGELGAGKTTLTRGVVRGMGHKGNVKSPTYTLVEPYELAGWQVYHFDLYRLADPEELEYMGIRDYFAAHCCSFIEWPEKGQGLLPQADVTIDLAYVGEQRKVTLAARSSTGNYVLAELEKTY